MGCDMNEKDRTAMAIPARILDRLPERLREAVVSGNAPVRVLRAVAEGQDGRGPRTSRPKTDVREFVKSLG